MFKSKSTTIITFSSEVIPECVCEIADKSGLTIYFLHLVPSHFYSIHLQEFWGFETFLLKLCHFQLILTGQGSVASLVLCLGFPWPSAPSASVCSATFQWRILLSATGFKFISSMRSSSCSVSLLLFMPPSISMALKLVCLHPSNV